MTGTQALDTLAKAYGILPAYVDLWQQERITSPETKLAFLRANGLVLDNAAMIREALSDLQQAEHARLGPPEIVGVSGQPVAVNVTGRTAWHLQLEGTADTHAEGCGDARITLPDLPPGVHALTLTRKGVQQQIALIIAPASLPSVQSVAGQPRIWGATAALYGLWSHDPQGLGDFVDLARLAETLGGLGAGFLGINPVHNWGWAAPEVISPYSPSHRGFLNSMHIAPAAVPGLQGNATAAALLGQVNADQAQADAQINYGNATGALRPLLERLFAVFQAEAGDDALQDLAHYCRDRGAHLDRFARFEHASTQHGSDWRDWPAGLIAAQASGLPSDEGTDFHKWLQWVADCQLADAQSRAKAAGMVPGLYLDLAVGARRGGAETWCEADAVAQGVSIGAPPDHLSPGGQNWDLAAFSPVKAAKTGYRSFREILRENMRHAGILRIDHVLGLNRSFWLPDDGSPGGYIRQPFQALMAIVAIEADRAGTIVVGEDLGLVPDGFRETMAERGLYGYSVLQYERDDDGRYRKPSQLRPQTLACFGTHDTPTLRGFWSGHDIDLWNTLGWVDDTTTQGAHKAREIERHALFTLRHGQPSVTPVSDDTATVANRIHGHLAESPVAMASVQLDDMLGIEAAQNLPGTIDEHPNWRRRCPVSVDRIGADPLILQTATLMQQHGRSHATTRQSEVTDED